MPRLKQLCNNFRRNDTLLGMGRSLAWEAMRLCDAEAMNGAKHDER